MFQNNAQKKSKSAVHLQKTILPHAKKESKECLTRILGLKWILKGKKPSAVYLSTSA